MNHDEATPIRSRCSCAGQGRHNCTEYRGRGTRRVARPLAAVLVTATLLAGPAVVGLGVPAADAATDGGASSRVVGRGDIVTSIIGWQRSTRSTARPGAPARCRWLTLRDAEIEWLTALSASQAAEGGAHPVLDSIRDLLAADELPDGDLQARVCGGVTTELRYVPRLAPRDQLELLHRRMITRLPVPDPVWSPPPAAVVPVHQPIFVSIAADDWTPIENTITVDDITAEVRARPVGLRVIAGDPAVGHTTCDGPGRPFDHRSAATVRQQAGADGACTISYRSATPDAPSARPQAWVGTVTVLWAAEWRTDDGAWQSLGVIPRTRLFDRSTREVRTAIESRTR